MPLMIGAPKRDLWTGFEGSCLQVIIYDEFYVSWGFSCCFFVFSWNYWSLLWCCHLILWNMRWRLWNRLDHGIISTNLDMEIQGLRMWFALDLLLVWLFGVKSCCVYACSLVARTWWEFNILLQLLLLGKVLLSLIEDITGGIYFYDIFYCFLSIFTLYFQTNYDLLDIFFAYH